MEFDMLDDVPVVVSENDRPAEGDRFSLKLKDGRLIAQVDLDRLPGSLYFNFQRIAAQNQSKPEEAMKWVMMRLFTVNGKPMTIDMIEDPFCSGGLGLVALIQMGQVTSNIIQGLPSPKTSSSVSSGQDGD